MDRCTVASVLRINAAALVLVPFTKLRCVFKRSFGKVAGWFSATFRHLILGSGGAELALDRPAPSRLGCLAATGNGSPIRAQPSISASLRGNVGLSPNLSPNRAANDR
jgi:hypothetical protein